MEKRSLVIFRSNPHYTECMEVFEESVERHGATIVTFPEDTPEEDIAYWVYENETQVSETGYFHGWNPGFRIISDETFNRAIHEFVGLSASFAKIVDFKGCRHGIGELDKAIEEAGKERLPSFGSDVARGYEFIASKMHAMKAPSNVYIVKEKLTHHNPKGLSSIERRENPQDDDEYALWFKERLIAAGIDARQIFIIDVDDVKHLEQHPDAWVICDSHTRVFEYNKETHAAEIPGWKCTVFLVGLYSFLKAAENCGVEINSAEFMTADGTRESLKEKFRELLERYLS